MNSHMNRLLLAFTCLLMLASCERSRPGVQADELRILANWIEDRAHGIPRRPGELELMAASGEFTRAAQWAMGSQRGDERVLPPQLQSRSLRATALAAALRSRVVLIDNHQGLVGPAPSLTGSDFLLAAQIADAENHDRRAGDALVIARCEASGEAAQWYRDAVRTARIALDTAAGGTVWQAP